MANLAYRRNSVARLVGSYLAPGASYTVTAYAPGARVNGNQTGTTITVDSGHGFPSGSTLDSIVVRSGAMVAGSFTTCAYASATTVTLGSSQTLLDGDRIVHLGNDTGTTSPNYDGSTITIYSDDYASDTISQSRVTCNSSGEYEYRSEQIDIWELVRDSSGTVVDLVCGVAFASSFNDYWTRNHTTGTPKLTLTHITTGNVALALVNSNASAQNSPQFKFTPSGGGALSVSMDVTNTGDFNIMSNGGTVRLLLSQAGVLSCTGSIRAGGDNGGETGRTTLSNGYTIAAAGAVYTVRGVSGATLKDNSGWIKFYINSTAYYVPVWASITG